MANYKIPQQLLYFKTHLQKFHPLFMNVIMFRLSQSTPLEKNLAISNSHVSIGFNWHVCVV